MEFWFQIKKKFAFGVCSKLKESISMRKSQPVREFFKRSWVKAFGILARRCPAGGSVDVRDGDDKVATCVDPNTHSGIGDCDGGKERRWTGTPAESGSGAVVTAIGVVAAGISGQDRASAARRCNEGSNPIMKSRNSLRGSVWLVGRLRSAVVN
jgi:hypothetical protein